MSGMRLELTLKSDMCAAIGMGYLNLIDTDVSLDAYGLPFIPARRMKGCLREAAGYIGVSEETVERLFGRKGQGFDGEGSLRFGNGTLPDAEEIHKALDSMKALYTSYEMSSLFTRHISRTAVDESGVARAESLRTYRVINHYRSDRNEEMRFYFPLEGGMPEDKKTIEDICAALRHMGLNRMRGLGVVHCRCGSMANEKYDFSAANKKQVRVTIRLMENVIVAASSEEDSNKYIPGNALLGALAKRYWEIENKSVSFEEIFLSNKLRFGNLYPCGDNVGDTLPAPAFVGKVKSTDSEWDGKILTSFEEIKNGERKPLRGAFVSGSFEPVEADTEITIHHSGKDLLYTQTGLCAGQRLSGTISADRPELMEAVVTLLNRGPLRLGRSKTAQYARCEVESVEGISEQQDSILASADQVIAFALQSDVILTDENGIAAPSEDALLKALLPELPRDAIKVLYDKGTALNYTVIHGYNSKRNLRNVPMCAIEKGSAIIVRVGCEAQIPRSYGVGLWQNMGYGRICAWTAEELQVERTAGAKPAALDDASISDGIDELFAVLRRRKAAAQKARDMVNAYRACWRTMTPSYVGRLLLMAEQAEDWNDLTCRVKSVKDAEKLANTQTILGDKWFEDRNNAWRDCLITLLRLIKINLKKEEAEQ